MPNAIGAWLLTQLNAVGALLSATFANQSVPARVAVIYTLGTIAVLWGFVKVTAKAKKLVKR